MTDPVTIFIAAIPGVAKAVAAIAEATDPHKRQAQFAELQQALIQLQTNAFSIQTQNLSLLAFKDDLEKQIVQLKNWEAEKQRYALVSIFEGTSSVIALKESMSNGEPPHWLCPNCFHSGKKSFLHPYREQTPVRFGVCCSACPTKIPGPWSSPASPEYAPG